MNQVCQHLAAVARFSLARLTEHPLFGRRVWLVDPVSPLGAGLLAGFR
jgi:hypothetical protein